MSSIDSVERGPRESKIGLVEKKSDHKQSHIDISPEVVARPLNELDEFIKVVEQEGREARNLLIWSVPVGELSIPTTPDSFFLKTQEAKKMKKPPLSPRSDSFTRRNIPSSIDSHSGRSIKRFSYDKSKILRMRSLSAERDPKLDLHARYWAFLFENLQRAIDKIYQTCDTDESVIECKETIMMLENYIKEFVSLIEWLNLNRNFENSTPAERPTSLAWEVKKTSHKCMPLSPTINNKLSKDFASSRKKKLFFPTTNEISTQTDAGAKTSEVTVNVPAHSKTVDNAPEKMSSSITQRPKIGGAKLSNSTGLRKKSPVSSKGKQNLTPRLLVSGVVCTSPGSTSIRRNIKPKAKSVENTSVTSSVVKRTSADPGTKSLKRSGSLAVVSFDKGNGSTSSLSSTSSNGRSWADKVKGSVSISTISESEVAKSVSSTTIVSQKLDDNDGWETVQRGKNKMRTPPPSSLSNKRPYSSRQSKSVSDLDKRLSSNDVSRKAGASTGRISSGDQKKIFASTRNTRIQLPSAKSMPALDKPIKGNSNTIKPVEQRRPAMKKPRDLSIKAKSMPDVSKVIKTSKNSIKCQERQKETKDIEEWQIVEDSDVKTPIKDSDESLNKPKNSLKENYKESDVELEMLHKVSKIDEKITDWSELMAIHEGEVTPNSDVSWSDSVEPSEIRPPGRAIHLHEKLSSPSRKRPLSETIKRHAERQAKAQEQRERILEKKAQKLREQSKKIEEVRALKEGFLLKKKGSMERRLEKAEMKRRKQLELVIRKAHNEETKVNEIAFINTLEAQNKRLDLMSRHKDIEARLQDIQEERQRRLEEKAAKEVAAEERRKALESERLCRLQEMQEKRKQRDMKIEQQLQEKEKERLEMVREKARDREQRLSALTAAQTANTEELQRKIKFKQEESSRRHEESIEQKRQKAFESSVKKYSSNNDDAPRLIPYDMVKMCTLCNVLISSEVYLLSHLRGKVHREAVKEKNEGKELVVDEMERFNLKMIVDAPADNIDPRMAEDKERQKALKKRCKKIRHRMMSRATEFENMSANKHQQFESQNKAKLARCIKEINRCLQNQGSSINSSLSTLERHLGEISRLLDKKLALDQVAFRVLGGLEALMKIISCILAEGKDVSVVIPSKILVHACAVFQQACSSCRLNCNFILYSSLTINVTELTLHKWNVLSVPKDSARCSPTLNVMINYMSDPVAGGLMGIIAVVLSCLAVQAESGDSKENENNGFQLRSRDVVSYIVSIGIVDKIYDYFKTIQGPIDNDPAAAQFIHQCIMLLTGLIKLLSHRYKSPFETRKQEDVTQLKQTLDMTNIVGSVSMLYGILLHGGAASPEGTTPPPQLPSLTTNVAMAVLQMLNHIAILDLKLFQTVLGSEGTSLELRHISSYLTWYCSHWSNDDLLHEVIVLIGYFTALNSDNQAVLQSGLYPTVLQQLCALPFNYFSDPFLTMILFPTLISWCHGNDENKEILEQDMSSSLLANFIENQQLVSIQADLLPSKAPTVAERWIFQNRFPEDKWKDTYNFFNPSE